MDHATPALRPLAAERSPWLRGNGVSCEEGRDSLVVEGTGWVDQSTLATSFPDFVARFEDVGAGFIRYGE